MPPAPISVVEYAVLTVAGGSDVVTIESDPLSNAPKEGVAGR